MPYLQVENVSKTFVGVKALTRVSLAVDCGEVLAIAGENGAGKSTLMKILTGVYQPDAGGEIRIDGVSIAHIAGTSHARELGVCIIYQELSVVDNLTIAENIFLSKELTNRLGFLDKRAMNDFASGLLASLGIALEPAMLVGRLSVGQKQMVEIAKAISNRSKIVIMDEPTASLSHHEATVLKATIRKLRADGIGIIYITHRLEEIFDLADRVTVLRDGRSVGSHDIADIDRTRLVQLMVDRDHAELYGDYVCHTTKKLALAVEGLDAHAPAASSEPPANNGFRVHEGEILGFFGLIGAGRTEMMEAVFGLRPHRGSVSIGGRVVAIRNPRDAIRSGIGFVTEDRKKDGLVLGMNVRENFSLTHLGRYAKLSFVDRMAEALGCQTFVRKLGIKTPTVEQKTDKLSGGNQQKIVISKWVARSPRILIVDEPTRGIDIAAKADVHKLLQQLASHGMAIIVVSSDLPEVLAISDRVNVVRGGRIVAELSRQQASQTSVMEAAAA